MAGSLPGRARIPQSGTVPLSEGEVEVRQVFEPEEFEPGEAIEHHRRIQNEIAKRA